MARKCDFCGKSGARSMMENGAHVCDRCVEKLGGFATWDEKIKTMGRAEAYEVIFGYTATGGEIGKPRKRINPLAIVALSIFASIVVSLLYISATPNAPEGVIDIGISIAIITAVTGIIALVVIGIIAVVKGINRAKANKPQREAIKTDRHIDRLNEQRDEIERHREILENEKKAIEYERNKLNDERERLNHEKARFESDRERERIQRMIDEYERKRRQEEEERRHWKSTDEMTGIQFEQYCLMVLKRDHGFVRVETTKTSGDYGGDLVGYHKDGSKWVIQCKRYGSHVGVEAVQQVVSAKAMYKADRIAVMTNNVLTASAKELASKNGVSVFENIKGTMRFD